MTRLDSLRTRLQTYIWHYLAGAEDSIRSDGDEQTIKVDEKSEVVRMILHPIAPIERAASIGSVFWGS